MSARYDVAVVGSGIIGLGAAYAAVKRGLSVVVIDRAAEPLGASVRNFGHLCIGAQAGIAREHADTARGIWLTLARNAGFWLREHGTHVVARHDDEMAVLEAAARDSGITLFGAAELRRRTPVQSSAVVGGAHILTDLQVNPREAGAAIRAYLAGRGVEFRFRTAVLGVETGAAHTSRGSVTADTVVVAVNHDVDELLPELAEVAGVVRCSLDMLRVQAPLAMPLSAPLLTGWSLVRYGRFAALDEINAVRTRLHTERPDLAAIDLNQMYTQLPDGSLLVGDTHHRGASVSPFQPEVAAELLRSEAEALFGVPLTVAERWQGVYASGRDDFLVAEPHPGVVVLAATTGIGMTCGLGLAENTLGSRFANLQLEGIHA